MRIFVRHETRASEAGNSRATRRAVLGRRALIALGAGAALAAATVGSAASLGGLTVESLGAETELVTQPFDGGVSVQWGQAYLDDESGDWVVGDFTIVRNFPDQLIPYGRLSVGLLDENKQPLSESAIITSGAEHSQRFSLETPVSVGDVTSVAVAFSGRGSQAQYGVGPQHIGTDPGAVWLTGSDEPAVIVDDEARGTRFLELTGDGAFIKHSAAGRFYGNVDNSFDTRLDWQQFVNGGVSREIDPVTQSPIQPEYWNAMTVNARTEGNAYLWVDLTIAYGETADDLSRTRVSCLVGPGQRWETFHLDYTCGHGWPDSSTGRWNLSWVATDGWTVPGHTYAPGENLSRDLGFPAIATVEEYGFRIEGDGSVLISSFDVRSQRFAFDN